MRLLNTRLFEDDGLQLKLEDFPRSRADGDGNEDDSPALDRMPSHKFRIGRQDTGFESNRPLSIISASESLYNRAGSDDDLGWAGAVDPAAASDQMPSYAILSHTWEYDEVLYADVMQGSAASKKGFSKIRSAMDCARKDGFEYIWIDTCCIDKGSSAELSEAINSMYTWYSNATTCYAYLADVSADVDLSVNASKFAHSKWFTRGWCLQELLAPRDLVFFAHDWRPLGDKMSLCVPIAETTRIGIEYLNGSQPLQSASVAKRMSWAAYRKTSRTEDIAYCLMGLFGVNMPMLYGEGHKAFYRLQEEIMRTSDDYSLFAWVNRSTKSRILHGLLADSPADFAHSGQIYTYEDWTDRVPFDTTNRGLRIHFNLKFIKENVYMASLNCPVPPGRDGLLYIYLERLTGGDQFARVKCHTLGAVRGTWEGGISSTVFVSQRPQRLSAEAFYPSHYFLLRTFDAKYKLIDTKSLTPRVPDAQAHKRTAGFGPRRAGRQRTDMNNFFRIRKEPSCVTAVLRIRRPKQLVRSKKTRKEFVLMLGMTRDLEVGLCMLEFPFEWYGDDDLPEEAIDWVETKFEPKPAPFKIDFEDSHVSVEATPVVQDSSKIYMIDIKFDSSREITRIEEQGRSGSPIRASKIKKELSTYWSRKGSQNLQKRIEMAT